ncbi:sigma-24 (FecI-like) [Anaeromyxobacter dehalogenans 2CP-C]|uniref:Sigma-24 (FecI-like) n=1 Tax=Anaeromyxobacter dehalogenans (strain 2CP-C) TaxID=290397 RepID=Q2IJT3_ANADE|nr:sigma-24 (FecI-like) [Anaeromyxobacter dehalogenans 2CP-C]
MGGPGRPRARAGAPPDTAGRPESSRNDAPRRARRLSPGTFSRFRVSHPPVPGGFLQRALAQVPFLRRNGRRLARNAADADDLVQETLVRALERQAELRDPARLRGWLGTLQRSIHLNAVRGLRPRLEVLEGGRAAEATPDAAPTAEEALLARALGDGLAAALGALPPEWREALWLREVEELSYQEIARVQGCPVGTVRSRLARARRELAGRLRAEDRHVGL